MKLTAIKQATNTPVTPAKVGVQSHGFARTETSELDSRLRGNDEEEAGQGR